MLQELVLVVALSANILDHLLGASINLHELIPLRQCHTASCIAANASQSRFKVWTEVGELLSSRCEAQIGCGVQGLKGFGAFV
jgi:hypothetical protein